MATLPAPVVPRTSLFGTLLVAALVIVLAWQLAHWTWVFISPRSSAAAPALRGGADLATAAKLFGGSDVVAETRATPSGSGLRLKGVVAPSPGTTASAVFNAGGKDIAVMLDGEVQPGVRLVAVRADHVLVSRGGVRERIDLDIRIAAIPKGPGAMGGPPQFRLNVGRSGSNGFTFSRKDLENALKDPGQLNYLGKIGSPSGGGVRVDEAPAGSLASKLGLQSGDVIKKVNGQSVASAGDLARLHQTFSTTSLIQAEIQRGSAMVQLNYTIQ
jgi:general secretion pathway protein C